MRSKKMIIIMIKKKKKKGERMRIYKKILRH